MINALEKFLNRTLDVTTYVIDFTVFNLVNLLSTKILTLCVITSIIIISRNTQMNAILAVLGSAIALLLGRDYFNKKRINQLQTDAIQTKFDSQVAKTELVLKTLKEELADAESDRISTAAKFRASLPVEPKSGE